MPVEAVASLSKPLGFSADGLAQALMIPEAGAVIRNARLNGRMERIGRGAYRSLMSVVIAERFKQAFDRAREAAFSIPSSVPCAMDGASAVFVWTRGAYVAGWTEWRIIIELVAPRSRERQVRNALKDRGITVFADYPRASALGVFAKLKMASELERTVVGGVPVISKIAVSRLVEQNPGAFAGALELITEEDGAVEVLR